MLGVVGRYADHDRVFVVGRTLLIKWTHTMASKKEAGGDSLPKYGEFKLGQNDSLMIKDGLRKLLG